jgi:hypothetical protein
MNKRYGTLLLGILLILSLVLVACGGDEPEESADTKTGDVTTNDGDNSADANSQAESPTNTPEPAPTDTPVPAPTDTPEPEVDQNIDLSAINTDVDAFSSYAMEMSMVVTLPSGEEQGFIMSAAYNKDPLTQVIEMEMVGAEDDSDTPTEVTMVLLDGMMHMATPGEGCFSFPASAEDAEGNLEEFLAPTDFTDGLSNLNFVGVETVNGIETRVFEFDENDFADMADSDMQEASGRMYIALDGDYLVRMEIEGIGSGMGVFDDADSSEATPFSITYNISNIDEPVEAVLPEGCDADSAESDYPVADDAAELMSMPGFATYTTAKSSAEMTEFYQDALVADGWEYSDSESFSSEGFATLVFNRDGETLSVNIIADEGQTTVLISAE